MELAAYKQIMQWARELDGVFTTQDLKVAFNKASSASRYRAIAALIDSKDLIHVKRGCYATAEAKLSAVASRLYPKGYISTGTVLAASAVIGSVPQRKIQVVQVGTPASFACALGTIECLSIAAKLFFGFERREDAFWATPEKAYLDACYFHYKGRTFSFDLYTDVDQTRLSSKVILEYLAKYDQRFITYFRNNFWQTPSGPYE